MRWKTKAALQNIISKLPFMSNPHSLAPEISNFKLQAISSGTDRAGLEKADVEYYEKGQCENYKFWSRLDVDPSFKNLKVLDVGCGHGSLCMDIANRGAKKVIGIDISERLINFAKKNILLNYPHFCKTIDFSCCDIFNLRETDFDVIVSKDSFEHILNLENELAEIKNRLIIGGKLYIGFGPLYNSVFGDHGRTRAFLPWGHLIYPEQFLLRRLNRNSHSKTHSVHELGLNKLSLAEYEQIFITTGLKVTYFQVNKCNHPISKIFSLLRQINCLKEYFSHNIYCVMEKEAAR